MSNDFFSSWNEIINPDSNLNDIFNPKPLNIDAMPSGEEIDALIAAIMEPKPTATKTYRELEREGGGNYTCWDVTSPGGWWKITISWGDVDRNNLQDTIPDWTPAKEPSEEMEAAWQVIEKLKDRDFVVDLKTYRGYARCKITYTDSVEAESMGSEPLAICRATIKAMIPVSRGKEEISMDKVFIGDEATIVSGKCAGISGMVVGADSKMNTVKIRVEVGTYITTNRDNISQK